MESIPTIGIVAVLAVTGLSLLAMLLFGVRSFVFGKVSKLTSIAVLVPVILLVGLGFGLGDWAQAAIYSLLIMLGLAVLTMVYSSVRGLFGLS